METITATAAGTQRGQGYETACADCGTQTTIRSGNPGGPHYCQPCWDRRDAAELARVDAHVREQCRDWSTPELEEYVSLADRDLGGYHAFCHDAAAAELDRRRRSFNPDFIRYSMLEDGCGDFAGMTDEEVTSAVRGLGVDEDADEIERVESGDLDPYDMRDYNDR